MAGVFYYLIRIKPKKTTINIKRFIVRGYFQKVHVYNYARKIVNAFKILNGSIIAHGEWSHLFSEKKTNYIKPAFNY